MAHKNRLVTLVLLVAGLVAALAAFAILTRPSARTDADTGEKSGSPANPIKFECRLARANDVFSVLHLPADLAPQEEVYVVGLAINSSGRMAYVTARITAGADHFIGAGEVSIAPIWPHGTRPFLCPLGNPVPENVHIEDVKLSIEVVKVTYK